MNDDDLDQMSVVVLAGVKRLGALEGFPVTDFALVGETDLDLGEVRRCLWSRLADRELSVAPGELDGSAQVTAVRGGADQLPDLGASGDG